MQLFAAKLMAVQTIWSRFRANGFLQSIGLLIGGTGLGAVISALVLPILTRLYTPADFGLLAVFNGLVVTISVAACLRFDVAIPIPEDDSEAVNVLGLSVLCAAVISILLGIVLLFVHAELVALLKHSDLEPYLWLVPIGIFSAASYTAVTFWAIRKKDFGAMAQIRVAQASAAAGVQVGFGWFGGHSFGLVLGTIVNTGFGFIGLSYRIAVKDRAALRMLEWPKMLAAFSTYYRFPKYSALEALSNSAGMQLPIILIATLATRSEAGFLLLALSIIQAPMGLMGNAVAQVYLSRAPDEFRNGRLNAFTVRVFGGLIKAGVGPLIFGGILAPAVFAKIFGPEWYRAGVLVLWMTPWFVLQFLATPIAMALQISNNQKLALLLQLSGLVVRTLCVYVASFAGGLLSEAYALSGLVFYFSYLVLILYVVRAQPVEIFQELKNSFPVVLIWILAGGLCLGCISLVTGQF
jgi:O-antigen/teichoic acid export membrane protein